LLKESVAFAVNRTGELMRPGAVAVAACVVICVPNVQVVVATPLEFVSAI
jgi:hypothetical protein